MTTGRYGFAAVWGQRVALLAPAMLLAGCWGDGTEAEAGRVVAPTGAATAASVTTRAVAGPVSPSATNTYVPYDQTNFDYIFNALNSYASVIPGSFNYVTQPYRSGFAAYYVGSTGAYQYGSDATNFYVRDIVHLDANRVTYSKLAYAPDLYRSLEIYTPLIKGRRPLYVRPWKRVDYARAGPSYAGYWQKILTYGAFGKDTLSNETFDAAPVYDLQLFGSVDFEDYDLGQSSGTISIDPVSGQLKVRFQLIGNPSAGGSAGWVGSIESDGFVRSINTGFEAFSTYDTGFLRDANTDPLFPGNGVKIAEVRVEGMFFGPSGREIGGSIAVVDSHRKLKMLAFAGMQR